MKTKINFKLGSGVVVLALLAIIGWVITAAMREPELPVELWPSFRMIYQEFRYPHGYPDDPARPLESDTWQFDYVNQRNWRLELIDSTYQPYAVGDWYSYDGEVDRAHSAILGVTDEILERDGVSPNDWLVPSRNFIANPESGYVIANSQTESGRTRYILEVPTFKCNEGRPICPSERTDYTYTNEIVFTNDYGIPVEVVDKLDDIVSSQIVLVELIVDYQE